MICKIKLKFAPTFHLRCFAAIFWLVDPEFTSFKRDKSLKVLHLETMGTQKPCFKQTELLCAFAGFHIFQHQLHCSQVSHIHPDTLRFHSLQPVFLMVNSVYLLVRHYYQWLILIFVAQILIYPISPPIYLCIAVQPRPSFSSLPQTNQGHGPWHNSFGCQTHRFCPQTQDFIKESMVLPSMVEGLRNIIKWDLTNTN